MPVGSPVWRSLSSDDSTALAPPIAAIDLAPPVVARVTRGGRDESIHRGFGAVTGVSGAPALSFGDPETPVYWRSAAKPFQAIPFLEAGGESAFALSRDEIALAVASHDGEPAHAATADAMLRKGGFTPSDLRCGAHPPYDSRSADALVRAGEPFTALHNNCSGKHAAMLLACRLLGFDPGSYDDAAHPLQRRILEKVAFYAGVASPSIDIGIDGCSLPVFRLPIASLATAYARLVAAEALPGEPPEAAAARRRIVAAMTGSPFFVSGSGEFTTHFLAAGAGRWIGKEGAEGVYAVAIGGADPRGIAFKVDDGGSRARFAIAMDIMGKLGEWPGGPPASLAGYVRPLLRSVRGIPVGEIVADVPLRAATAAG